MNLLEKLGVIDVFQCRVRNDHIPLGGLQCLFKLRMADNRPCAGTEARVAHQANELFSIVLSLRQ